MSSPPPEALETKEQPNNAVLRLGEYSLRQQLGAFDLNDPGSHTELNRLGVKGFLR